MARKKTGIARVGELQKLIERRRKERLAAEAREGSSEAAAEEV